MPGAEHHGHLSGRGRTSVEHRDRALGRDDSPSRAGGFASTNSSPARRRGPVEPGLDGAVARRDDAHDQPDARAHLLDPAAVGGRDEDALNGVAVERGDLPDLGGEGAGGFVGLADPCDLRRPSVAEAASRTAGCTTGGSSSRRSTTSPGPSSVTDAAAAAAASSSESRSRRLEYAYPNDVPCPTRTPAPRSVPVVTSSIRPSSSRTETPKRSSTNSSENAPPRARAARRTSCTRSRSSTRRC